MIIYNTFNMGIVTRDGGGIKTTWTRRLPSSENAASRPVRIGDVTPATEGIELWLKIAVLVSGGGSNLQALIDASKAGQIPGGKLALVLASKPDAFALERARQAGIPTAVCARRECR